MDWTCVRGWVRPSDSTGSGAGHSGATSKPDPVEARRVWATSRACVQSASSRQTPGHVVVHEAGRLHERVDDRRADEAEAARAQLLRERRPTPACFAGISARVRGARPRRRRERPDEARRARPAARARRARSRSRPRSCRGGGRSPRRRAAARHRPHRTRRPSAMRNSANAARKASRLRRIVIHASPAWKPSSVSSPNSASSPCSGRPHSSSW